MTTIQPIILCGGSGTRLWPSSRKSYPKQFSPLLGQESLYQMTVRRLSGASFDAPVILTNEEFRFMAADQASDLGLSEAQVVLEPVARDTAPAILSAALMFRDEPEKLLLVAPSDHLIADEAGFLAALEIGAKTAAGGRLVTFGIVPDAPETGFGYLEVRKAARAGEATELKSFVEKPDAARASEMIATGRHYWNGGIFMFRAGDILAAFDTFAADMVAPCQAALDEASRDLGFLRLDADHFASVRAQSIDYAVMEKSDRISVVPMDVGWSDLGSWEGLWKAMERDQAGNVTQGSVTAIDCENSLLRSEDAGLHLVGLGLRDTVAVAMRDAVLVADKEQSQKVKTVVAALQASQADQADDYPRFHRPWGWYETLCIDARFQVKRIMVKPGGILSLQSHHHRSEHWVVVSGTAEVTIGEEVKLVSENESVYIPLGTVHRMANPGKLPMYLIEVQTGSYLGEDDIMRYEDIYDRS